MLSRGGWKENTNHHKEPRLGPEGHMCEKTGGIRLVFRLGYILGQEIS